MFEDMFKQAMITLQEMAVRTKQRAITGNILYAPFATNLRFFKFRSDNDIIIQINVGPRKYEVVFLVSAV